MKRRKKLWVMGAILGLVLVLTVSAALIDHKAEQIRESGETILSIPADTVTALSWQTGSETLSFTREEETWHDTEDPDFPVSTSAMKNLLYPFENMTAAFVIREVEDFGQYGLEDPLCTVTLTAGDQDYSLKIGAFSAMDAQRYVTLGDDTVYLLHHDPMEEYQAVLSDVIQNDDIPYLEEMDRMVISGPENYEILRSPENGKSFREKDVYFAKKGSSLKPLDPQLVENYLENLTLIGLSNYQTYTAGQEDLTAYGMEDPELTIQVDYTYKDREGAESPRSFTVHFARKAEDRQEPFDLEAETVPPVYARLDASQLIYEIRPSEFDQLLDCSYDDLRHREILPAAFADFTQLDLTLEGKTYTVTTTLEDEAEGRKYFYEDREFDIDPIRQAAQDLKAETFTEEAPRDQLELRLDLTLETEEGPQTVRVELYRHNGTQCLARVDGSSVALIPRDQAVTLMEAIHTLVLGSEETEPTQAE